MEERETLEIEEGIGGSGIDQPNNVLARKKKLNLIEQTLLKQSASALEKAGQHKKNGEIESAKTQLKFKKLWDRDIEMINEIKSIPDVPCPKYRVITKEIKKEIINDDLSPHVLELSIIQFKHIKPPQGYTSLSVYASVEVPFPSEETPQTFTSPTLNCESPHFTAESKWITFIPIERSKPLATFLKKKIVLSLYHYRYLWSDVPLGTVEVKPNMLSEKSTVLFNGDILENKKPTGGKVTVQLRLQFPVIKREYDVKYEKILMIEKHFSLADVLEQDQDLLRSKNRQQRIVAVPQEQKISQTKIQKNNTNQPVARPTNATEKPEKLELENNVIDEIDSENKKAAHEPQDEELPDIDTESLDWIVSERVLQHRLASLKQGLGPKGDMNLAINAQILAVESRINAIIGHIQQGELTIEQYSANLNTRISDEKRYAEYYGKKGNTKYRDACLVRVKLMQEELTG